MPTIPASVLLWDEGIRVQRCFVCGERHDFPVPQEYEVAFVLGIREYLRGDDLRSIQDIFPFLSPAQREVLLTGTGDACWSEAFREEEEE